MKKLILASSLITLMSCSPSSPKLEYKVFGDSVKKGVALDFNPKVDILFVVDDSGSMASYQDRLARNVDSMISSLSNAQLVDYHIGVITSSMTEGYYPMPAGSNVDGRLVNTGGVRYIDRSTPNGLQVLKSKFTVGSDGDSTERFFTPVQSALSDPMLTGDNLGFYRSDASLVVIFITDAEDQSTNPLTQQDYLPQDYYNFLVNLKAGDASLVAQYGIIIPSAFTPTDDCPRDDSSHPPFKIEKAISMFKGLEYNICDPNYNSNLNILGQDILQRVSRVLYLTRRPVPDTIVVKNGNTILPNDATNGWTYDPARNAIIFTQNIITTLGYSQKLDIDYTAVPEE